MSAGLSRKKFARRVAPYRSEPHANVVERDEHVYYLHRVLSALLVTNYLFMKRTSRADSPEFRESA